MFYQLYRVDHFNLLWLIIRFVAKQSKNNLQIKVAEFNGGHNNMICSHWIVIHVTLIIILDPKR